MRVLSRGVDVSGLSLLVNLGGHSRYDLYGNTGFVIYSASSLM